MMHPVVSSSSMVGCRVMTPTVSGGVHVVPRKGKVPPVARSQERIKRFTWMTGDWLQSLRRASVWNGWSKAEELMQLAEFLCGHQTGIRQQITGQPQPKPVMSGIRCYKCN